MIGMCSASVTTLIILPIKSPRSRNSIRCCSPTTSSSAIGHDDQSRGSLPRFYSRNLPTSKGSVVRVQDDEFWHMAKVLRLGLNARVELFNGSGGLIEGCIRKIDRNGLDVVAVKDLIVISPKKAQWHVFAAFGALKGGRADWLVEKCTELGASSVTPILTQRSSMFSNNKMDRLQRVILAATKQCQRTHKMILYPPLQFCDLVSKIAESKVSLFASAGATPVITVLSSLGVETGGIFIVGPEGDFTNEETETLINGGALPIGLGPCRLRVETAAVTLLSALELWSDHCNS